MGQGSPPVAASVGPPPPLLDEPEELEEPEPESAVSTPLAAEPEAFDAAGTVVVVDEPEV
jgi:hypothetical protein